MAPQMAVSMSTAQATSPSMGPNDAVVNSRNTAAANTYSRASESFTSNMATGYWKGVVRWQ